MILCLVVTMNLLMIINIIKKDYEIHNLFFMIMLYYFSSQKSVPKIISTG